MKRLIASLCVLCGIVFILGGCASMQPLSNYARTGDTVAISLGGTDYNALAPVLNKNNITISITDSGNNTYPVKLRNVIRIFLDPTSVYEFNNLNSTGVAYLENIIRPHQGLWIAVVDLVDPINEQPHPLQMGPASLSVTSVDIQNWVDIFGAGVGWTNGDLSNIPIEILAGTGSPNPLNYLAPIYYAPIDRFEAAEQLEIRPDGVPSVDIGGAEFVMQFTNASFQYPPRIATTSPDPNVQVGWSSQDMGDGTSQLTIVITNPHGFVLTNNHDDIVYQNGKGGKSLFDSLRYSVFWVKENVPIDASNWQNHINLLSAAFMDVNGVPISGLAATVTKVK